MDAVWGAEGVLSVENVLVGASTNPSALYQDYWKRWLAASSTGACAGDYSDALYCRSSELSFTHCARPKPRTSTALAPLELSTK